MLSKKIYTNFFDKIKRTFLNYLSENFSESFINILEIIIFLF